MERAAAFTFARRNLMAQTFKTKLMAVAFVPALALAATAAYATGDKPSPYATGDKPTPSANATGAATAPATTSNMQGSMKSETTASADATFDRLDVNHDGKLSASEAAADPKVQAAWKKIDATNKGSVSKAEFQAHVSDIK